MKRSKLILIQISCLCIFTAVFAFSSCATRPEVVEYGIFAPSRLESVIGQDGVCSIKFNDQITLWTFADTITGRWKSEKGRIEADKNEAQMDGMLSNSIAWSEKPSKKNYRNLKLNFYKENGRTAQFIKNRKDENPLKHRFWALDGFRTGEKVYVYYLHVYVADPSKFLNFEILNVGLARWDVPKAWKPGDAVNFRRLGPLFGKGTPYFGAAVMVKDGHVFLAGHFNKGNNTFPLSIAKVKIEDVENSALYSFLSAGGEWIGSLKDAGFFIGDVSGECSLSYNDYLEKYIIIYSKSFTGNLATVRFRNFKELPLAESETVFEVGRHGNKEMWPYSGKEIFNSEKSIFVIYIDPSRYQPLLVELRY